MQRNIPTAYEMDEFFAFAEKQQQAIFMEKCVFLLIRPTPIVLRIKSVIQLFMPLCILFTFCRYNFDVVNDVPLPGRYEWVPVLH